MWSCVRAELFVLRRWPVAWALVLLTPVVTLLSSYVVQYVLFRAVTPDQYDALGTPDQILGNLLPDKLVSTVLASIGGGAAAVPLVLLGVAMSGGDWGRGTVRDVMLQRANRWQVWAGRLTALVIAAVTSLLLTAAACTGATALIAAATDSPSVLPSGSLLVRGLGLALMVAVMFAVGGLLLGTLVRNVGGAIALAVLYLVVVSPFLEIVGYQVKPFGPLSWVLPDTAANQDSGIFLSNEFFPVAPVVTVLLIPAWTLVFAAISAWLELRRDIGDAAARSRTRRSRSLRPPAAATTADLPRATLGAAVRAELFALIRRPTAWAFAAITPVFAVLHGYLLQLLLYASAGSGTFAGLSSFQIRLTMLPSKSIAVALNYLGGSATYDGTVAPLLLGAIIAGSSWSSGTMRTAVVQGTSRWRAAVGQELAVLALQCVSVLATFALCAATSEIIAASLGDSLRLPAVGDFARGLGSGLLTSLTYATIGMALGTLFRNAGAATAAVLVWTQVITPNLDLIAPGLHGDLATVYRALPNSSQLSLTQIFGYLDETFAGSNPIVHVAPAIATIVLAGYAVALLVLVPALTRFRNLA